MQWRQLAILVAVVAILLGASMAWFHLHRGTAPAASPKFIPITQSPPPQR